MAVLCGQGLPNGPSVSDVTCVRGGMKNGKESAKTGGQAAGSGLTALVNSVI